MKHPFLVFVSGVAFVALTTLTTPPAFAQGGATSAIGGTVVDPSGAVLPGATIVAKNNATSFESTAVSTENGTFTIPSLNAGTYTVTVTLTGFKTVVLNDVVLNAGVPASVRAVLAIGGLEETVVVQAASEIIQTQAATVASTLNANQITKLPVTSRNALDFIVNLPGVNTAGGNRDSTINGLPQSAINITLDGMNIQDNYLKTTDGFFARLSPRLDAIEEVTLTAAANNADSAGQGAVNIRFVTRSGSNQLSGSSYFYMRHDALNANTWFNNRDLTPDPETGKAPKTELRQYQPGTRVGGPVVIPGLYDGHDKAFFFVNYEETRAPSRSTLTRTILSPEAQAGLFRYNTSSGVQERNLLTLAAQQNNPAITSTMDPTIAKVLGDIRAAATNGAITNRSDPLLQQTVFQTPVKSYTPAPTVRLDYNLSRNNRLTGSFNYQHINSNPDTTNSQQIAFPGFSIYGSQQSTRYSTSEWLRTTIGTNLVNELRGGATGGATYFSPEKNFSMWSGTPLADQTGYHFDFNDACCGNNQSGLQNAGVTPTPSSREASTKNFEDTLTWLKGNHSFSFGGAFTQADLWLRNQTLVPTIDFDVVNGDPADAMFNTTNFPGASNTQLNNARGLYAILTGRVSAIASNARFNEDSNQYDLLGLGTQRGRMREIGLFAQDSWRWRPNVTLTMGLRYEIQRPFHPLNDSYSTATINDVWGISGVGNLFAPGVLTGQRTTFQAFPTGASAFKTDWNNFAPTLGATWAPAPRGGFLGKLLGGDGDTVLRGGYALGYERHGMSDFSGVYGANPGVTLDLTRSSALGNLNADGLGLPVLFRDGGRLSPPSFALTPQYPLTQTITGELNIFAEDLQVPYSQTWTASIGRAITRDIGIDVRYVGTRHLQGWIDYNYNEINIVENNFLNEFRTAQANLRANIAAGRGNTFAYTGAPGTSPLPIFLAHYNARPMEQAGNTALYTGNNWTNSTFVGFLAANNPNPYGFASTNATNGLIGNATFRGNAGTAGLPANFFLVNPEVLGGTTITGNGGYTRYDSIQIEARKRLSHGFQIDGSYVYGKAYESSRYSFRLPRSRTLQTGSDGGVMHAFKGNWVWELPFGEGRKWMNTESGFLKRLAGGWEFDGVVRVQSGRLVDYGNVRLVGMTREELQKAVGLYTYAVTGLNANAATALYLLPQDIVENTVKAFNVSATSSSGYSNMGAPTGRYLAPANGPDCIEIATGAGQCGTRTLVLAGPRYARVDLSAVKRVRLVGRTTFEFRGEMLNAFNHPNFVPVLSTSTNADNYRITDVQENSSRIVQLVWRVSW
jgi:Carboxypeptidase regulatory-like domain/TonB dependent receptor/TonB-dependent Receptor Plug Domain